MIKKKKASALLSGIANQKTGSVTVTEPKLIKVTNGFKFNLVGDDFLNNFLEVKGNELLLNEINSNLEAGKILSEVYEKLGGVNQHDGLYSTWLQEMGYNARTALRNRVRFGLFMKVKNEKGKELIAKIPVRLLDKLNVSENQEEILKLINNLDINSKESLISFLESDKVEEVNKKVKPVIPFYKTIFNYEKKIMKLDPSESSKALEELKEIKKEISRLEKLVIKSD